MILNGHFIDKTRFLCVCVYVLWGKHELLLKQHEMWLSLSHSAVLHPLCIYFLNKKNIAENSRFIMAAHTEVDYSVKHSLQNTWTLWFDNPGKKTSAQSWADNLKEIISFDTVEDFWR